MSDYQVYLAEMKGKSLYRQGFAEGQATCPSSTTVDPNLVLVLLFSLSVWLVFLSFALKMTDNFPELPHWLNPTRICSALFNIPASISHRYSQIGRTTALSKAFTDLRTEVTHQKTLFEELERNKALSDANYMLHIRSLTRGRIDQIHRLHVTSEWLTGARKDLVAATTLVSTLQNSLDIKESALAALRQDNDMLRQSLAAAQQETMKHSVALNVLSSSNWQIGWEKRELEDKIEELEWRNEELERVNVNWVNTLHALHERPPRPVLRIDTNVPPAPPPSSEAEEESEYADEEKTPTPNFSQPFLPLAPTATSIPTNTSVPVVVPRPFAPLTQILQDQDRITSLERTLAERDYTLSNKDTIIRTLNKAVEAQRGRIASFHKEVLGYKSEIGGYRNEIEEYKGKIEDFEEEIKEYACEVEEYEKDIEWRDDLIECNGDELEWVYWRLGYLQNFANDMMKVALWEGKGFEDDEIEEMEMEEEEGNYYEGMERHWAEMIEDDHFCDGEEECEDDEDDENDFEVLSAEDFTSL
ncbi:hypothetical protein E8E13_008648 [Curvularia kusanoi]|uniref:Uncharacterized protein n=1 Tax=Curvularia kusanoi TaxID=90978 RepID=A0A9P4TDM5_CURKU|nr:hypothetical protein E8E13_008648 [Curvularia kusanoi]